MSKQEKCSGKSREIRALSLPLPFPPRGTSSFPWGTFIFQKAPNSAHRPFFPKGELFEFGISSNRNARRSFKRSTSIRQSPFPLMEKSLPQEGWIETTQFSSGLYLIGNCWHH